jgi:hypothetical protein
VLQDRSWDCTVFGSVPLSGAGRAEAVRALKVWQQVKGFQLYRAQVAAVIRLIEGGRRIDTVLGDAGVRRASHRTRLVRERMQTLGAPQPAGPGPQPDPFP